MKYSRKFILECLFDIFSFWVITPKHFETCKYVPMVMYYTEWVFDWYIYFSRRLLRYMNSPTNFTNILSFLVMTTTFHNSTQNSNCLIFHMNLIVFYERVTILNIEAFPLLSRWMQRFREVRYKRKKILRNSKNSIF